MTEKLTPEFSESSRNCLGFGWQKSSCTYMMCVSLPQVMACSFSAIRNVLVNIICCYSLPTLFCTNVFPCLPFNLVAIALPLSLFPKRSLATNLYLPRGQSVGRVSCKPSQEMISFQIQMVKRRLNKRYGANS
jgi:hypothetical protein